MECRGSWLEGWTSVAPTGTVDTPCIFPQAQPAFKHGEHLHQPRHPVVQSRFLRHFSPLSVEMGLNDLPWDSCWAGWGTGPAAVAGEASQLVAVYEAVDVAVELQQMAVESSADL